MAGRTHILSPILVLLAVTAAAVPLAAASVAVYGVPVNGTGPYGEPYSVSYSVPAQSGELFDRVVSNFTAPTVAVIVVGGDSTFSNTTAAKIEQAVWDGRTLLVYPQASERFGDCLPLVPSGTSPVGDYLVPANPGDPISKNVFAGYPAQFNATAPAATRVSAALKPGAVALLKYANGEPVFAYRKYGSGYVAEWTLNDPPSALGSLDTSAVAGRLFAALAGNAAATPATPSPAVTANATPVITGVANQTPASDATMIATPAAATLATGNITIQSSPLGATVFVDGVFKGITPLELSGVQPGYHAIKMTMDGRYDYDGSAYVVAGQGVTAFGSLPPQQKGTATAQPTTAPATTATTAAPAAIDPMTNPAVIAAVLGAVSAAIGAIATIYTHHAKQKKE